jgi:hypothetical protein
MTTNLYRKLNNYDFSPENIDIMIDYLENGIIPDNFTEEKEIRFKAMCEDFAVRGNDLYYEPLNLKVIRDQDKRETMLNLYNDPNQGMGLGIQSMYNKLAEQYLNIKRKDVSAFIKQQSVYQITKPEPMPVNKPIIGHQPNERWAVDLIDMIVYEGYNKHYKFILSGIDYFSKKIFAVPLRSKTPLTTLRGLEQAIAEQMGDTYPRIIQSDNGGEFKNKTFKEWARAHQIHLINTLSYTPTGNALVENSNKWIRKMIREGFIRYNSFNWVDHLQEYVYNRNEMKHSVLKKKPNAVWSAGHHDDEDDEDINLIKDRLIANAKKKLARVQVQEFEVGDVVRASMSSLYSKVRKIIKSGKGKLIPVKYSPDILVVSKVIPPSEENKDFARPEYLLETLDGEHILTEAKKNDARDRVRESRRFFGSDLQRVTENQKGVLTRSQAEKLNLLPQVTFTEKELETQQERRQEANARARERRKNAPAIVPREPSTRIRRAPQRMDL